MTDRADQIISVVSEALEVPPDTLSRDSSMDTVLQWDSLAHLNICLLFEERFNLQLDMEEIAQATSVDALLQLLASRENNEPR